VYPRICINAIAGGASSGVTGEAQDLFEGVDEGLFDEGEEVDDEELRKKRKKRKKKRMRGNEDDAGGVRE
jgi:hypothetical protein